MALTPDEFKMLLQGLGVLGTLLAGGLAGAGLKIRYDNKRSRKPEISFSFSIDPILSPKPANTPFPARVVVGHGSGQTFDNLYRIQLVVLNRWYNDIPNFTFGVTFEDGSEAIFVEAKGDSRFQEIEEVMPVASPQAPKRNVDFVIKSLNRDDPYTINFFVVNKDGLIPRSPSIGSGVSVKFKKLPTAGEEAMYITGSVLEVVAMTLIRNIKGRLGP